MAARKIKMRFVMCAALILVICASIIIGASGMKTAYFVHKVLRTVQNKAFQQKNT